MLHHAPAEQHRPQLRLRRLPPRDDLQIRRRRRFQIPLLQQERIRAHAAHVPRLRCRAGTSSIFSRRRFFFFCKMASASGVKSGATITSLKISAIASAQAASSARFTAMMPPNGACRSVANALSQASRRLVALPDAARIGVLENRQRRRIVRELRDQARRRRQVENVVVGKFLAVQLLEVFVEPAVKRRRLVRVLAVAQRLRQRRLKPTSDAGRRRRLIRLELSLPDARRWPRRRPPCARRPSPPACAAVPASCRRPP